MQHFHTKLPGHTFKKKVASRKRKKGTFLFIFKEKKNFSFSMGTFMLVHKTPKIGLECPVKTKKKTKKNGEWRLGFS